jgi:inhibitor of KinA sporulation pathway (predicted exonuclease)
MKLTALIYSVEKESFFTVIINKRKVYFYLQKNLIKKFMKYLEKGTYVTIDYDDNIAKHKGICSYTVNHFIEISKPKYKQKRVVYYDLEVIRDGIRELVDSMNPILFIDFEMNMQDYQPIPNFEQEIIEAGMVLTDETGAIMKFKHWYLKPTKFKKITKRTMKFLHYSNFELDSAVPFKSFYKELKEVVEKYNTYVIVWGKSDITQLKKTCQINGCADLKLRFVNLLQLHTNYDNLKNSPGLFSMWESYNDTKLPEQMHNSLEDAMVTKDVFFKFKEKIKK